MCNFKVRHRDRSVMHVIRIKHASYTTQPTATLPTSYTWFTFSHLCTLHTRWARTMPSPASTSAIGSRCMRQTAFSSAQVHWCSSALKQWHSDAWIDRSDAPQWGSGNHRTFVAFCKRIHCVGDAIVDDCGGRTFAVTFMWSVFIVNLTGYLPSKRKKNI